MVVKTAGKLSITLLGGYVTMDKKIHATFATQEEAQQAKEYLAQFGYEHTHLEEGGTHSLSVPVTSDNWEGAFQILNGFGGDPLAVNNGEFTQEMNEYYNLNEKNEEQPIPSLSKDAFFDPNIGPGDTELKEPYILHTYHAITEEKKDEPMS